MIVKKFAAVFIACYFANAHAQNNPTDSLRQAIAKEKQDTSRVKLIINLGREYLYSKPDSTFLLSLEALSLARRVHFVKGEALSLTGLGDGYENLGNYPKAFENYFSALRIYEGLHYEVGIRRCLGVLGNLYAEEKDYRRALEYSSKAKEMSKGNQDALCIHLLNMGDDYNELGLFDSGKIYNQQSYELAKRINKIDIMGCALINLGESQTGMNENSLALEYFRLGVPYLAQADDEDILCEAYMGMASLFRKADRFDSALHYAKASFATEQNDNLPRRMYDAAFF